VALVVGIGEDPAEPELILTPITGNIWQKNIIRTAIPIIFSRFITIFPFVLHALCLGDIGIGLFINMVSIIFSGKRWDNFPKTISMVIYFPVSVLP